MSISAGYSVPKDSNSFSARATKGRPSETLPLPMRIIPCKALRRSFQP